MSIIIILMVIDKADEEKYSKSKTSTIKGLFDLNND